MSEEKEKSEEVQDDLSDPTKDESSWASDQEKRSYYYDDAHGYEIYNPDENDDDSEDNDSEFENNCCPSE